MLQLCADDPDTVLHALRDITKHTRGGMQPRWRQDGFARRRAPPARRATCSASRTASPTPTYRARRREIWSGCSPDSGEPGWAVGGTYQVIRIIRMLVEFWDRVSLSEQENMFGRRRDTGAPLDGSAETDIPGLRERPGRQDHPADAHIRLANPRTAADREDQRSCVAATTTTAASTTNGNLDIGLIFTCYQQDIVRQFEAVQTRLIDEPLVDYI